MSVSDDRLYDAINTTPAGAPVGRSRVALTSPLIAYSAAAAGSIAVWFGLFKLIFG